VSPRDPLGDAEPLIRRVYAYCAYRLGDGPEAEDVTGETFERALRYRDSYDPGKGSPIAWLIGIARRLLQERRGPVSRPDPTEAVVADDHERTLLRLTIAAALRTLDERDRELIALRYGADLSARQIGELLGLQANAVDVALHRARERLRAVLEQHGAEP
jgi:RNA polymerase sigma-70 factor (ECF subfamily)